jgi:hypothetical protein
VPPTACLVPKDRPHRPGPNGCVAVKVAKWPAKDFSRTHLAQGGGFGTSDSSGARFPHLVSGAIKNNVLVESTTAVWPQVSAIRDPIKASAHTPMITTIAHPMRLVNRLLTCRPMIAGLLPTRVIIAIKGGASTPLTAAA